MLAARLTSSVRIVARSSAACCRGLASTTPQGTLDSQPQPEHTVVFHNAPKPADGAPSVFAIVKLGPTQFKVTKDDLCIVDHRKGAEVGRHFLIPEVLMIGTPEFTILGRPQVQQSAVVATVEQQTQDGKKIVFKMKRRQGYMRKHGFRRQLTYLRIGQITFDHDLVRRAAEKAGLAAPDLEAYKMAPVPEYTPLGEVWPDQEMVAEEDGGSA